jgi:hypothetical protein
MSKDRGARVAGVAAAALLALSCSSTSGGALRAGEAGNTVVNFSYRAVDPETVRIAAGGNVRWVNLAPETRGYVVFPASIAPRFSCADLQPYFERAGNVYLSRPIIGMQSERVELPCPLAPGTYDYEIWLMGSGVGTEFNVKPEQILRAKIVVE